MSQLKEFYNTFSREDLLKIQDDCLSAINGAGAGDFPVKEREILQAKNHEEIALQVFKEWANNNSLWRLGYDKYLKDSTYNNLLKWKSHVILSKLRS